jgi:hypothetical protein
MQAWKAADVVTNYANRLQGSFNELMNNLSRTIPIGEALQVCVSTG